MKNYKITITGKVQKVRYRLSAVEIAEKLGITGYVMNLSNGDVFAEIEGTQKNVDDFINWCKKGPEKAIVENVSFEISEILKNFKKIQIIE